MTVDILVLNIVLVVVLVTVAAKLFCLVIILLGFRCVYSYTSVKQF